MTYLMREVVITYCVPQGLMPHRNFSWDQVWLQADNLDQAIAFYGNGFEMDGIWIAPGAILQMKMKD